MRKVKLIVHETYQGKRKSEDVFGAVFLSNAASLTLNAHYGIIKGTNNPRIHFVPGKEQLMEQVRNEQSIYSVAAYCRFSKDDEQAGKSVSIKTQKMMLIDFCHERGFSNYEIHANDSYLGLNFNGRAFTSCLRTLTVARSILSLLNIHTLKGRCKYNNHTC